MGDGSFAGISYAAGGNCAVPVIFNSEYVRDAMKVLYGDTVDIYINSWTFDTDSYSGKAAVFTDGTVSVVIMPCVSDGTEAAAA